MGRAPLQCKSPSREQRRIYTPKKAPKTKQGQAACCALGGCGPKLYALGVDETQGQPAPEYTAIDHPWFANDTMPIYRWTFPSEASAVTWLWPPKFPYELFSEPVDAERWAKKQLATKLAQLG